MTDIENAINKLEQVCVACDNYKTSQCSKIKCNVGFALKLVEDMGKNGLSAIDDGLQLIPNEDTKFYDDLLIAQSIASICKLCKNCNELHNEACTISLARKSLEGIFVKNMVGYPGNVLTYIVALSKQNPEFAGLIMNEYKKMD
ncbi:MAG: hypothetical protein K0S18_1065 [Anaerocolumna sp.]|jgi:hypothetical protein|nr:hypothetical protein [Anaerocolumna sp.]